ncbi:MAG: hemerythrin domain-containing protein [Deltaproteobacteria bacterium]|nr:hemerythrin domain-containing protein [Deltaproteobacteria bacterium]
MPLFQMLQKDHDEVKQLFSQIEKGGDREKLFSQLKDEVNLHQEVEEKFFYPALEKSNAEVREKVFESYEEHHVAKTVLKEFDKMSPSDERWKAKLMVLKELVEHHIEEEEKELFKMAKKALDKKQIQEITDKIEQRKSKAKSKS